MKFILFWREFFVFSWWGLETVRIMEPMWIIGSLSLVGLIVSTLHARTSLRARWRPAYWSVFSQFLFYPLAIVVGIIFQTDTSISPVRANMAGEYCLDTVIVLSLLSAFFWIYYLKGSRWIAISLMGLQQALMIGASFIAGMSVTGDWI